MGTEPQEQVFHCQFELPIDLLHFPEEWDEIWARNERDYRQAMAMVRPTTPMEWEVWEDPPRSGLHIIRGTCLGYPA